MRHRLPARLALACGLLAAVVASLGLVNPGLQPNHLFDRYGIVLDLEMGRVDAEARTVELQVRRVCKGTFAPTTVTLDGTAEEVEMAFLLLAKPGTRVVAFLGGSSGRNQERVLFYPGGLGRWQMGRSDPEDAARWAWTTDIDPADDERMLGTFNGDSARLAEMMGDRADGRYYFPSTPEGLGGFGDDIVVARCDQPVRGVAIHDLDGDGRPDLVGCSASGDRVLLQRAPMVFTDATAELGLAGSASPGVGIADVDGDGAADLLLGTQLWLGSRGGAFRRVDALPADVAEGLLSAVFVELDGDGRPDIVVARRGGLRAFRNPGAAGAFPEITAATGLDSSACGAGLTGHVGAGDWNGDGRTDLFFGAGTGLLLVQGADGCFAPVAHGIGLDFRTDGAETAQTGTACFAPLWESGRDDLVVSGDTLLTWIGRSGDGAVDLTQFGNEIHEGSAGLLPVIAEDLNADGWVDLYAGSRQIYKNAIYMNRGYGSFLTPLAYKAAFIPGPAHQRGALGVAAGDVDGDGAVELLLGGPDGALTLLPNRALADRSAEESSPEMERILARTGILSVHVRGPLGVVGAQVTLADAAGRIVGRRMIGGNLATGCRGPDTADLAVREPGPCTLTVRWSDGTTASWPVTLSAGARTVHDAVRPATHQ